jgi:hypothetical protein
MISQRIRKEEEEEENMWPKKKREHKVATPKV